MRDGSQYAEVRFGHDGRRFSAPLCRVWYHITQNEVTKAMIPKVMNYISYEAMVPKVMD